MTHTPHITGRTALVLGAGASTGGAFEAGVLAALQDELAWDARRADLIVGTSIGSIVGTLLRCGLAPRDLYAYRTGSSVSLGAQPVFARIGEPPAPPAQLPRPYWPMPPAGVVARALRHPWRSRAALMTAALPRGRHSTGPYTDVLRKLTGETWPRDPLWIVAARLPNCERVAFGLDEPHPCDVAAAVSASCAVPGYFAPVTIDGVDHVDGGVHSPTNADLVADQGFDTVVVVSPMSTRARSPRRIGDPIRLYFRALLGAEVKRLRRAGVNVIVFQPGEAEQRAMGLNAFDEARCPDVAKISYESACAYLTKGADAVADAA